MASEEAMKTIWTPEAKDYIGKEFIGWLNCLHLTPMITTYNWKEEDEPSRENSHVIFRVFGQWPYREANLDIFPKAMQCFKQGQKDLLSMYLLHEAFHVLLRPMTEHRLAPQNFYSDMEEMTVETLTSYVWHQRKYDEKKDAELKKLHKKR